MSRPARILPCLALGLALASPAFAQQPCAGTLDVQPAVIPIDLWYGGTVVQVRAQVPASSRLAVVLEGPRGPVSLHKKGKAAGVLWMNVGVEDLDDVPSAYLLATTGPLSGLGSDEELQRFVLGYRALSPTIKGDADTFTELVKLKEQEGSFGVKEGALLLTTGATVDSLTYDIPLSARVPEGEYTVRLVELAPGAARCLASSKVTLRPAGAAKAMRALAFEHGLLYGCAAVLIAIVAGLATGLVFGKGSSKGH